MRIQASLFLAAISSAYGYKTSVYPLQDSTIFGGEAEKAKAVGTNIVGLTEHGIRRALMQFDFSSLPSDAIVTKVTMDLDVKHNLGVPKINMFRVTSPWSTGPSDGEDGSDASNEDVTWKYSTYSTVPWTKEGGDYDTTLLSNEEGDLFLSTSALESTVQDMIHGTIPNFGFILIGDEDGVQSYQTFGSMEEKKRNSRPTLVVEYESLTAPAVARKNLRYLQSGDGSDGNSGGGDGNTGDGDGAGDNGADGTTGDGDGAGDNGTDGTTGDGDGAGDNGADGTTGDGDGAGDNGNDGTTGDGDGAGDNGADDGEGGSTGGLCFSGESMVEVQGQGHVSMDSLKIGDFVRVQDDAFAQVYSFGHYQKDIKADYLEISTAGLNTPLQMSADHMVFVQDGSAVPVKSIKVGDVLVAANGDASEVMKIKNVIKKGAYAPFTSTGTIVVNGIVASNYVSFMDGIPMQWIAHSFNSPHRMVCAANFAICESETYTNGLSAWIAGPLRASEWLMSQNAVVKAVGVGALMASLVMVNIVETLFMSPMLVIACVLGCLYATKKANKAKVM